jgi:hypothetical protein
MNKIPSKNTSSHGVVRGADFDQHSSQFEGRFGRIFRSLPAASWSETKPNVRQAPALHPNIGKRQYFDVPDLIHYALGK